MHADGSEGAGQGRVGPWKDRQRSALNSSGICIILTPVGHPEAGGAAGSALGAPSVVQPGPRFSFCLMSS